MKWILLTFVIITGAALAIGPNLAPEPGSPAGTAAGDSLREASATQRQIFAAGVVEGSHRTIQLNFEISGRVADVPVVEGQLVAEGDVLARLDEAIWQHKVDEAEARLELARAERSKIIAGASEEAREVIRAEARLAAVEVEHAEAEKNRANQLHAQNAISEQDFDKYQHDYELAVSRYRQAWARVSEIEADAQPEDIEIADSKIRLAANEVQQARTMLAKTQLRAPTNGRVLQVDVEPGELINSEGAAPILAMANTETLRIRGFVEELDAMSVSCGQAAYVTTDGRPDIRYTGVVTWVAPAMGPKEHRHHKPGEHHNIEIREVLIALDDPQDLVVGLPVDVYIDPPVTGHDVHPHANNAVSLQQRPPEGPVAGDQVQPVVGLTPPAEVFASETGPEPRTTMRIRTAD